MKALSILILGFSLSLLFMQTSFSSEVLRSIPVQNGGRIKPLDTLARESVRLIHGKEKYMKKDSSKTVLTWLLVPETWNQTELIRIDNLELKKALQLDESKKFYSLKTLSINPSIQSLLQNLNTKRKKKVKLGAFDQALQKLESQMMTMRSFQTGDIFSIGPQADTDAWASVNRVDPKTQSHFTNLLTALSRHIGSKESKESLKDLDAAALVLKNHIYEQAKKYGKPVNESKIKAEIFFNKYHMFRYAWICYLLALLLVFGFSQTKKEAFRKGFLGLMGFGFLLHLLGFLLRVYISGRAPVSNMYETVLWVPFGTLIFGALVGKWGKNLFAFVGSCVVAVFCLILSDLAPNILDPSIQPLEAVLRSNYWLLTHVLTITISYSAFFLAFILGDFSLYYHLNENKYRKQILDLNLSIYRSLQIGVLLLAVGTVLGGIWADESWGRFWGWDPKETWAFIALMGYLAILHGRLVGMLKTFGMAASSVVAFSLVIMAWYGVNFWLGAGLHSYGFGSGGVEYVSVFVLVHILYVIFVGLYRKLN